MFVRALYISITVTCLLATSPLSTAQEKKPDLEKKWYDELARELVAEVPLDHGKLVFTTKELKNRKLFRPIILRYDAKEKVEYVIWAEEAEIRFDAKEHAIALAVKDCQIHRFDGAIAWVEGKTWVLPLPK